MAIVPIARDASVSAISLQDTAIDWERSRPASAETLAIASSRGTAAPALAYQAQRMRDPGSWRELIAVRDGHQPTEFIIGVIPPSVLTRIEDECRLGRADERTRELCWRSFLACLRDIRHGPTTEVLGSDGQRNQGVPRKLVDGHEYVDPDWLSRTFVGPLREVAIEIGLVAWAWQQLTPGDVKN